MPDNPDDSQPARPEPPVRLIARHDAGGNSKWQVLLDRIESAGMPPVANYLVLKPRHCAVGAPAGVCVLPVVSAAGGRQNVLLLRTYRHPVAGYFWEGARGFIDEGELPATAAARELMEETGLVCLARNLLSLGTFCQEPSTLACRVALFAALDCQQAGKPVMDEPGLGTVQPFELAEAMAMAADGRIEEASTSLALLRLQFALARRA